MTVPPDPQSADGQGRFHEDDDRTVPGAPDPGRWQSGHLRQAGETFESYKLIEPLGQPGGQGEVWKAEHVSQAGRSKFVALKIFSAHPDAAKWRKREFDALGQQLSGMPRCQTTSTTSDGTQWLAMDWIDGVPIEEFASGLSLGDRIKLVITVAEHLAVAHAKDLLHRDIRAGNILVSAENKPVSACQVWIIDWGLASNTDDNAITDDNRTIVGTYAGTPEYTAPEVFAPQDLPSGRGLNATSRRSDILALGVVLHRLVTGTGLYDPHVDPQVRDRIGDAVKFWASSDRHPRPIERLTEARQHARIVAQAEKEGRHHRWAKEHEPFDPAAHAGAEEIAEWERHLSGPLARVLLCATHEHPGNRYPHLSEFIKDLDAVHTHVEGGELVSLRCDGLLPRTDPWLRESHLLRVANDAALYAGADALIHKKDFVRARRLLSLVSPRSRTGWEFGYLSARAEPAIFVIDGGEP